MKLQKRKNQKNRKTNEEAIEIWFENQTNTLEASDYARKYWEAGQVGYLDYDDHGDIIHCEKFDLPNGGYIVVTWNEDGSICFGGM